MSRTTLAWMLVACLAVSAGCGLMGGGAEVSNDQSPASPTPRIRTGAAGPELQGLAARAESLLEAGRHAQAERMLRAAKSEGRVNERLMVLLAEAILQQGDARAFDQEFTALGRSAAFLESPRVRAAAARALTRGDSADRMIMLDTVSRSMARMPRGGKAAMFLPFVRPLSRLVDGDDRALAVLALDALTALPLPEAQRKLREVARGPDPVLSRLAAGALRPEAASRP